MIRTLQQTLLLGWNEADNFVKKRLILVFFLIIITAAFSALAPIALKYSIDGFSAKELNIADQKSFQAWDILSQPNEIFSPIILIIFYIFCLWISKSSEEIKWFFYGTADQRIKRNISKRLFGHVLKLPLAFHLDRKSGALNQTLVQGITGYSMLLNIITFTILPVLLEITFISIILALLLPTVFLVLLVFSVIVYAAAFYFGGVQINEPIKEVSTNEVESYATLMDCLLNSETVKYFTAENYVNNQYDARLAKAELGWASFYERKTKNGFLVSCIFAISLGSAVVLAGNNVMQETMTIGDFVLINTYMLQIIRPMEALGKAFQGAVHGLAFIEKMLGLLNTETENFTEAHGKDSSIIHSLDAVNFPPKIDGGELAFEDVSFSYKSEICINNKPLLKKINFVIKPGKVTAIVGHSGSGKSSIIRLLLKFFEQTSGDILLNGISTNKIPLSTLRQYIAVVPQDTILFNNSIAYNIGFGKEDATLTEIEDAAKKAHIHDKIMAMPLGYQTIVGERGLKLSGGEKQRISIARASLKNPLIFVFDEATSSLDSETERQVLDNLIKVSKNTTTLIITHRLSTVVHADEILVLSEGEFIERGRHEYLLRAKGIYANMWNAQNCTQRETNIEKLVV
ncbi:MAG: hypothetical protein COB49_02770 [Alphaproteobacteria bacterium]|nr:MAG: hypothetical protein COB49_02770 [Alphaproteobacteria bacterium]